MSDSTTVTAGRRELWVGGALVAVFVLLRVVPFVGAHTGRGLDSFDYEASARFPLLSHDFLAGPRPLGYPLYLKLVSHNVHVAVVGQLVLSTVAWIFLACMVARATRHPALKVVAAGLVLALGASFDAIEWDRILATEALAIACGVALLAALLLLRERWSVPRLVLVGVLALAATALRDSNGTFLGLVGVVLLIGVLIRRLDRRVIALGLIFVVVAALGSLSASGGDRWEGPLKDVITLRVLESPTRTTYFLHAGMPLSPAEIAQARGHCVSSKPIALTPTDDPALRAAHNFFVAQCPVVDNPRFFAWIHDHGRATYLKSLLKFPRTTIWEPIAHLRDSIGTRVEVERKLAAGTEEHAPISKFLDAAVFVRNPRFLALWALAVFAIGVIAYVRRRRGVFVVAVALVALTYPHLWLVWMGGALEVTRHSLMASVQLRLGLWLGTVWLLDHVLTRDEPEPPATEPASAAASAELTDQKPL